MLLSRYFIFRYMYKPSAIPNTASTNVMWASLPVELDANFNRIVWGVSYSFFVHHSQLGGSVAPVNVGCEFLSPTSKATRNLLTPL